ncbi:hypothetical protein D1114_07135 [Cereibacter sphaeroides]|uniref:Uncharacterized protein n=1 Tax=Cereibacter sphaeroides TaxID=1063 RepID=A0AAX1UNN0_CERSP|nr:hypothetical protein [Cereibacter sphaeroides]RHZ96476.1 hypothetical protein D1114_07135 [Cereibacter sphaeroides]
MTDDQLDAWQERAAIQEFDGGMNRFDAEATAAAAMGFKRYEAINALRERDLARRGDQRPAVARQQRADDMPAVQREQNQEGRPVSERVARG